MRPHGVVIVLPRGEHGTNMGERNEQCLVQELVSKTAVNSKLADRQIAARSGRQRVRIAHDLISQEAANSIVTLRSSIPISDASYHA